MKLHITVAIAAAVAALAGSADAAGTVQGCGSPKAAPARSASLPAARNSAAPFGPLKNPVDKTTGKPLDANNPDPAKRDHPILGLQMIRDFKATPRMAAGRAGRSTIPKAARPTPPSLTSTPTAP